MYLTGLLYTTIYAIIYVAIRYLYYKMYYETFGGFWETVRLFWPDTTYEMTEVIYYTVGNRWKYFFDTLLVTAMEYGTVAFIGLRIFIFIKDLFPIGG